MLAVVAPIGVALTAPPLIAALASVVAPEKVAGPEKVAVLGTDKVSPTAFPRVVLPLTTTLPATVRLLLTVSG